MLTQSFNEIFQASVDSLIKEISEYQNESDLWILEQGINNSGGNLALHLSGNLNYFIGARLGNTGFIRERNKEFSDKNIPKEKMLAGMQQLKEVINKVFLSLSDKDMQKEFGPSPFGENKTNQHVMINILGHLNYHLGQINYHRRLLASRHATV